MNDDHSKQIVKEHWERENLSHEIQMALLDSGKQLDALTLDDLAPFDQFHGGALRFTRRRSISSTAVRCGLHAASRGWVILNRRCTSSMLAAGWVDRRAHSRLNLVAVLRLLISRSHMSLRGAR